MVAYDSCRDPDPARALSRRTVDGLREALLAQWRAPDAPQDELRAALAAAAREARQRSLRPEELIIALKALQGELAEQQATPVREAVRRQVHEWMVTACIEAYFGDDEGAGRE